MAEEKEKHKSKQVKTRFVQESDLSTFFVNAELNNSIYPGRRERRDNSP